MKMEHLSTFLLANVILEEPELKMDFKEMMEREEFMRLLKENTTKKEEVVSEN